ncbi:Pectinacetylesterase family protein [Perilla frutescens var. hirtella]|uniref:Pectin acetylesterase n=1 Tax=Perilla frutescens var. hirtella TaxID=608512 RepID=A0AAD4PBD4_PERFH|nr:Pectinacetylesterase family protein [Perilla frutescens var. hirtella]
MAVGIFVYVFSVLLLAAEADIRQNNLTLLTSALSKGAVCLDGSPPAYAYQKGSESGSKSWIVFMEGGSGVSYGEEREIKRGREWRWRWRPVTA